MTALVPAAQFAHDNPFDTVTAAIAVLDHRETVVGWNTSAEQQFGFSAAEVLGRSARELLADVDALESDGNVPGLIGLVPQDGGLSADRARQPGHTEIRNLRRRDGGTVPTALRVSRLDHRDLGALWLVLLIPADRLQHWMTAQSVLDGLVTRSSIILTVYGPDARVAWINGAQQEQIGFTPAQTQGRYVSDLLPQGEVITPGYLGPLEDVIAEVFRTSTPVTDLHYRSPTPADPAHQRVWSNSYFRLEDSDGHPLGVCEAAFDITSRYEARQRLALLSRASSIGRTLDATRTAQELAEVVVPGFADEVRVELADSVLLGEDLPAGPAAQPAPLRCVAQRDTADVDTPVPQYASGPTEGQRRLVLSLRSGDTLLGRATFTRLAPRDPFAPEDRDLAGELVSRAAVCITNAWRFAREHATALALQHALLPHRLPQPASVGIAHHYEPAAGQAGVGGDWYDVVPLSGARVGLVVGDVAGHGLRATATMGRLRTTVRALAALDLDPGELLTRLDDLVAQARIGIHPEDGDPAEDPALGTRCLYAVYDPASQVCSTASAGHLTPVVVAPDGSAHHVAVPVGPPLGIADLPFESAEVRLAPGSMLALFTDGLVNDEYGDIEAGVADLCRVLQRRGITPAEACQAIADRRSRDRAQDDATLLLVRVQALTKDSMAAWTIPAEPAEVARARALCLRQLSAWDLDEVGFVVELIVSELVTNAIRYGGAPLCLRLLRDGNRVLICEVSDSGHTSPHLRRAGLDDEGGRGLYLVAQLTARWGTRYTRDGKTIWTEVRLGSAPPVPESPGSRLNGP
ncbi:ATP-binding SpoIIE family protein phosphatase [Streptomyces ipomoeae]|jgi:PAS domain S-box-containing protein|uniref:PAS domain S-box n=1 Tax=Streptomyces ipomoeae 91-03 TaxID=698759 RepID=L1KY54_9ACTN|nr:SpoIIE family protein phosphatase [Streptomyces ipomoeae]EKX65751.1 PAS domain S-box [Streptomyces ipomoeae 91-03]MDX2693302.1 SpoIIE family protein phosphatase [Streptomyces ipomoeae]MDX2838893.1 SpoIIE family protein phosphatase [Streptomyces ipomoeae]MDX2879843.1 SpoIIE family protein phosphatase [Streptomyces ipomoeae]